MYNLGAYNYPKNTPVFKERYQSSSILTYDLPRGNMTLVVFSKLHGGALALRPMLAAYQNFSCFSSLLLKIGLISCFGKSRAFQPAKPNVLGKIGKIYTFSTCGQLNITLKKIAVQIPPQKRYLSKYTSQQDYPKSTRFSFVAIYISQQKTLPV